MSYAGLCPPEGTYRSMELDTGKVGEPCSASLGLMKDEGESVGEEHGVHCSGIHGWDSWAGGPELDP